MIDLDDTQQVAQADRLGLQVVAANLDMPAQAIQAATTRGDQIRLDEPTTAPPGELHGLARLAAETYDVNVASVLANAGQTDREQPSITFDTHPAYTFTYFLAVAAQVAGQSKPKLVLDRPWLESLLPHSPVADNAAKQVALRLYQHIPLIWSAMPWLDSIAHDWRLRIARYAESAALAAGDAEMQQVWSMARFPAFWPNGVTIVRLDTAPAESREPRKLLAILAARRFPVGEVASPGTTRAGHAMHHLYFGNWVALYLAALYQVDPADRVPLRLLGLA